MKCKVFHLIKRKVRLNLGSKPRLGIIHAVSCMKEARFVAFSAFSARRHQAVKRHLAKLRPQHILVSELRPRPVYFFERRAGLDHLGHELLVGFVASLQDVWGEAFELRTIADEATQGGRVGHIVFGS